MLKQLIQRKKLIGPGLSTLAPFVPLGKRCNRHSLAYARNQVTCFGAGPHSVSAGSNPF